MKQLEKLLNRIIQRVNINLREFKFDANRYVRENIQLEQFVKFYAFYGITSHHPLKFNFFDSSLAGSYFLGQCDVCHSILYKSDIRGDELKCEGEIIKFNDFEIPVHHDEEMKIIDSLLFKNLVHNFSHDPENLEAFIIQNTISMHFANIHGAPTEGCFLCPFSTVDLTTIHDSIIGNFSYVQTEEMIHQQIAPGTIWVSCKDAFSFYYKYPEDVLSQYIAFEAGAKPTGIFIDFIEERQVDFQKVYNVINREDPIDVPEGAALDRYAVVKGDTSISNNVLVAQRSYLENATLGKGANAQENCYIIDSCLDSYNVTAHGAKIIHAWLGQNVFVGFNSFLRGKKDKKLEIHNDCIVMPHTIIDLEEPLTVPSAQIIWGYIRNKEDLKKQSASIESFKMIDGEYTLGSMIFKGSGSKFIKAFQERIMHILEANGAFFDGSKDIGHAQKNQAISFNTIQPYPEGDMEGMYPAIKISV